MKCSFNLNEFCEKANQFFAAKKQDEFKAIVAAYSANSDGVHAPDDAQSNKADFSRWCEKRQVHVVCLVEGGVDVLLVDALMQLSAHATRLPPAA